MIGEDVFFFIDDVTIVVVKDQISNNLREHLLNMEVVLPIATGVVFVYLMVRKIREPNGSETELTPFDPMELIHEDDRDEIIADSDLKMDEEYYTIECAKTIVGCTESSEILKPAIETPEEHSDPKISLPQKI